MEVDRRDRCDRIHAALLRVRRKLHAVFCIVAGDMADDRQTVFRMRVHNFHYVLDNDLALVLAQINAFSGRTVDINSFHTLADEVLCQLPHRGRGYSPLVIVACVKCGKNSLVFVQISHCGHLVFPVLAFNRAHGNSLCEIFLENQEYNQNRNRSQRCAGHDQPEIRRVLRLQLRDTE